MTEQVDHLAHYGKKGMKWGQRMKQRNSDIKDARARQRVHKDEFKGLKKERLRTTTDEGRKHVDKLISDKKYVIKNGSDAALAKQKTTAQKVMKGTAVTALMSTAASAVYVAAVVGKFAVDAAVKVTEGIEDTD